MIKKIIFIVIVSMLCAGCSVKKQFVDVRVEKEQWISPESNGSAAGSVRFSLRLNLGN